MKNLLIIFAVIAATYLFAYFQGKTLENQTAGQALSMAPILRELPSFETVDLKSGSLFNREEIRKLKPRVLVVHFWGTWCGPCEAEFPSLLEMANKMSGENKVQFLFIAVKDIQKSVEKFVGKFPKLPSNVTILLNPNGEILQNFGTVKIPETYIFDSKLLTQYKLIGPQDWSSSAYQQKIMNLLN